MFDSKSVVRVYIHTTTHNLPRCVCKTLVDQDCQQVVKIFSYFQVITKMFLRTFKQDAMDELLKSIGGGCSKTG